MNGFEKRKERKKHNIITASFELFSKYGVQKVSIQQIAKAADVSQVTIYNYFGGKDQLLLETIKSFAYDLLESSRAILHSSALDFKGKLDHMIHSEKESFFHMDADFIQSIMSEHPEIKAFISSFTNEESIPLFIELIEQGKDEGYISDELSYQSIMIYIDMYAQALRKHKELYRTEEDIKRFTDEFTHLFFYGLLGDPS
ncbi:TetR/AcrR family transcriptional regulator [Halobacillus ihumii]|uniref:TetR/AcrR family transcriptional regulator n=1 Tax=Halobacillus ihumii TaxID=2686092 RepID=UPI0013D8B0F5|nr:TetR/AcrR family transcriptional regulator [Halobacillus ihumii]